MSLEDTPKSPPDIFELGDKLCTVLPGYINDVTPNLHVGNRGNQKQGYYVQRLAPNPLHNEEEHIIIWLIPISRSDELVPR